MLSYDLKNIFAQGKKLLYKKGEIIIRPEDTPQGIYLILEGYVKTYSITEQGQEHLFLIYKPGEIFPLRWAFLGRRQKTFYQAIVPTTVCRISKSDFFSYLKTSVDASFNLSEYIMTILDVYTERVDNLEFTNAYTRLVGRLISLVSRFGKKSGNSYIIDAPITHQDVANSINMTRETVSREFNILEEKGIAGHKNQRIIIYNLEKLKQELVTHFEKKYI